MLKKGADAIAVAIFWCIISLAACIKKLMQSASKNVLLLSNTLLCFFFHKIMWKMQKGKKLPAMSNNSHIHAATLHVLQHTTVAAVD